MSDDLKVIVAMVGSRDFSPVEEVRMSIGRLKVVHAERLTIITGDAPGTDTVVYEEAHAQGVPVIREEAHWPDFDPSWTESQYRYEKALAGTERNGRVVKPAMMLIAFFHPGPVGELRRTSSGTANAINQAISKGIPVHVWHEGHWYRDIPGTNRARRTR